jgi:serine/threonine-protein kinase
VVLDQLSTARTILQNDGFTVTTISQTDTSTSGTVIDQAPQSGQKVDQGSTVQLTVSSGPGNVTVPSVVGELLGTAERQLIHSKLKVGRRITQSSSVIAAGKVISTDPAAGQSPQAGTAVTITVSTGPQLNPIPPVTGDTEANAKATLRAAGFTNITTSQLTSTTVTAGNVISVTPAEGTKTAPNTAITLEIAKAPTTATVPNVQGKTAAVATTKLTAAGFKVNNATRTVTDKALNGIVVSESPAGGTTQQKNSTVTIVVGKYQQPTTTTTTTTTPPPTSTTTTSTTT